jgi:hypothetical protein
VFHVEQVKLRLWSSLHTLHNALAPETVQNGPCLHEQASPKRPRDANQLAWQIVQEATGQVQPPEEVPDSRNPAAAALSKLGAAKGEPSAGQGAYAEGPDANR